MYNFFFFFFFFPPANCNYVVDLGKQMKFSIVGIAGHDIGQNKVLTLGKFFFFFFFFLSSYYQGFWNIKENKQNTHNFCILRKYWLKYSVSTKVKGAFPCPVNGEAPWVVEPRLIKKNAPNIYHIKYLRDSTLTCTMTVIYQNVYFFSWAFIVLESIEEKLLHQALSPSAIERFLSTNGAPQWVKAASNKPS